MKNTLHLKDETTEMLDVWVRAHYPQAVEDNEFMRGILFVVDEALRQAVRDERQRFFASIGKQAESNQ